MLFKKIGLHKEKLIFCECFLKIIFIIYLGIIRLLNLLYQSNLKLIKIMILMKFIFCCKSKSYKNNHFLRCYSCSHLTLCFFFLRYWMNYMSHMILHFLLMSMDLFFLSLLLIFKSLIFLPLFPILLL